LLVRSRIETNKYCDAKLIGNSGDDLSVTQSVIQVSGFKSLQEGQRASFDVKQSQKGPQKM